MGTGASKILTVSYGTFSCTLEGFDEPFGMMKMVAEYFRDLAAQDRHFGAVPPQPEAETLHRLAAAQTPCPIEAHVEEDQVVLRAAQTGQAPAPAAVNDAVAEKLARIRLAVAAARAAAEDAREGASGAAEEPPAPAEEPVETAAVLPLHAAAPEDADDAISDELLTADSFAEVEPVAALPDVTVVCDVRVSDRVEPERTPEQAADPAPLTEVAFAEPEEPIPDSHVEAPVWTPADTEAEASAAPPSRLRGIAHLKAVVTSRFVRPKDEPEEPHIAAPPSVAPLLLVSEQRVDRFDPVREQVRSAPTDPVSIFDPLDGEAPDSPTSFAGYARALGTQGLSDLLEAAAAYTAQVEGQNLFSPPELMNKLSAVPDGEFTREERMRVFGKLLRQGKIVKVRPGQYTITEASRYYCDRTHG